MGMKKEEIEKILFDFAKEEGISIHQLKNLSYEMRDKLNSFLKERGVKGRFFDENSLCEAICDAFFSAHISKNIICFVKHSGLIFDWDGFEKELVKQHLILHKEKIKKRGAHSLLPEEKNLPPENVEFITFDPDNLGKYPPYIDEG